ncbi:unnamed protein product [Arabis nemorensis]|uniref:F-box associated beta-propeller type 3 domain-containing protein n=1 Tax=Arabis nemorensis TaxID=586526 RepID=A0A565CIS9_9BRAS|nr:unnamed protein product [Arabis nemorensis]
MQSTNGLLLCKCSCSSNQFDANYYIYNPATKQNTLLPRIIGHVAALSLAFDPSKSPHYKVFCLKRLSNSSSASDSYSDLYHIEVYSSNEGPWRRVDSVPSFPLPPTVELGNTVFWNGAVHWFGHRSIDCLSFDIDQEKIKILPLPYLHYQEEETPPDIWKLRFLEESRGNLYYIEVNDMSSSEFSVYEMERDGSSWSLKHNVDLEPLAAAFPEIIRTDYYSDRRIYEFSVIGIVKEETDAESYILLHIPNKLVKYNFKDKTFKALFKIDTPVFHFYGFRRCFQFIESLANV